MLSKEEFKRYNKQIMLEDVGITGQLKLKRSKVAVVGAGGLGCPVLQYLCGVGIGTIGIIDFDKVEESNLHRQILYTFEDLGKHKAEVAQFKLSRQNPHIQLTTHNVMLTEENASEIFNNYDIIVDGCDNFMTRYIVNDTAVAIGKPLIYGSILGYEGQLSTFNYKGSKNLRDIFPIPPDPEDVPSCSENGVFGTVPGIIGTLMAQEVLNLIFEKPALINTLMIYNCARFQGTKLNF